MVKVGLIGAGGISGAHLPAYRDHSGTVELAAVCDADEERAQDVADEFDTPYWTEFESFVVEAEIEAVDITLPHSLHYPAAKAALDAGKHVLVEKPFGTDLGECVDLVETAEANGLTLMVGQMQRFHPEYRALKKRLDAGELGAIRHARCDVLANQADMFPDDHWLYDGAVAGGGAVIGYAVHKLDLLRYFLGDVERAASWQQTVDERFEDAEDYATGMLAFENGANADFFATVSAPAMPYTEGFELYGDEGAVHTLPEGEQDEGYVGTPTPRINTADDPERRKRFEPVEADTDLPTENAFVNEILHFAECVETGAEPLSSGRDNLGTMAAMRAVYRSAESGGDPVSTEDVLDDAGAER